MLPNNGTFGNMHSTHTIAFQHNLLQMAHLKVGNNCKAY